MENTINYNEVKRETEKAYLISHTVENACGQKKVDLWWPKSQVSLKDAFSITVPKWLENAKLEEKLGAHIASSTWFAF